MSATVDKGVNTVSLLQAVFCIECETVSDSAQHTCTVCGSSSLVSLFRLLGGSLRGPKSVSSNDQVKPNKYDLQLTVKIHGIPAQELNDIIESMAHLAEVSGEVECLHINLESAFEGKQALKTAA